MRIWEGIEKEGKDQGIKTLFIECARILRKDLIVIKSIAKKRNIQRIYFGAGKVDVRYLYKGWVSILQEFIVILETTPQSLRNINTLHKFKSVVIRNDIQLNTIDNIIPKIDNGEQVAMYYNRVENNINTVKNGMYEEDYLLAF